MGICYDCIASRRPYIQQYTNTIESLMVIRSSLGVRSAGFWTQPLANLTRMVMGIVW